MDGDRSTEREGGVRPAPYGFVDMVSDAPPVQRNMCESVPEHSLCEGIVTHRHVTSTTTYRHYTGRTLTVCSTASMYAHIGGWFQTLRSCMM